MEKLNVDEGGQLRDDGMCVALENAESHSKNWVDDAYGFLLEFIKTNKEFLAEDVRVSSIGIVPEPPSKRAWGAVFGKAHRNNVISRIGYSHVKNPKAHRTPATLWCAV